MGIPMHDTMHSKLAVYFIYEPAFALEILIQFELT